MNKKYSEVIAILLKILNISDEKKLLKYLDGEGIPRSTLGTWKDRGYFTPEGLDRISEKLGIPRDNLLGKDNIPAQERPIINMEQPKEPEKSEKEDVRIADIVELLNDDPGGKDAVFHFLVAKKNFDRASKLMKEYVGKKLQVWFEFPASPNGDEKKDEKE